MHNIAYIPIYIVITFWDNLKIKKRLKCIHLQVAIGPDSRARDNSEIIIYL